MADIFDVSKAILKHFPHGSSTSKLQRIAYFTQGWTLALTEKPLFKEDFEAWRFGPVSRPLYNSYQPNDSPFKPTYSVTEQDLHYGDSSNLNDTELTIINAVIQNYGALTGEELSEVTCMSGTPWHRIRKSVPARAWRGSNKIISKDSMREYFHKILVEKPALSVVHKRDL